MKKRLQSLGFFAPPDVSLPYNYNEADYQNNNDPERAKAHFDFLQKLEDQETERLGLLEAKTSQLISQTGIVFSLLGLFVPILVDKISDIHFLIKVIILLLLLLAFGFYMLTINNALKNYNVKKFFYSKPSPGNVIKLQYKNITNFNSENIRDLLYCINNNTAINNKKATNLIHSFNSFRLANICTGCLVAIFSITLLFFRPSTNTVRIENPVIIKGLESALQQLKTLPPAQKDTFIIHEKENTRIKKVADKTVKN